LLVFNPRNSALCLRLKTRSGLAGNQNLPFMEGHQLMLISNFVGVHGFKGSGVQGYILVPGLHLGCVFTRKTSISSGLIQNLKPNWQLLGKMNICNEDFGSSMPSLSLTLNVEL